MTLVDICVDEICKNILLYEAPLPFDCLPPELVRRLWDSLTNHKALTKLTVSALAFVCGASFFYFIFLVSRNAIEYLLLLPLISPPLPPLSFLPTLPTQTAPIPARLRRNPPRPLLLQRRLRQLARALRYQNPHPPLPRLLPWRDRRWPPPSHRAWGFTTRKSNRLHGATLRRPSCFWRKLVIDHLKSKWMSSSNRQGTQAPSTPPCPTTSPLTWLPAADRRCLVSSLPPDPPNENT